MVAVPAFALLENVVKAPLLLLAGVPLLRMVALPALEVSKKSSSPPLVLNAAAPLFVKLAEPAVELSWNFVKADVAVVIIALAALEEP